MRLLPFRQPLESAYTYRTQLVAPSKQDPIQSYSWNRKGSSAEEEGRYQNQTPISRKITKKQRPQFPIMILFPIRSYQNRIDFSTLLEPEDSKVTASCHD